MEGSKVAKQELQKLIDKMKDQQIEPVEFFKGMIDILQQLNVTNEDLQGLIPLLLNFVNHLIQNMEKRGA